VSDCQLAQGLHHLSVTDVLILGECLISDKKGMKDMIGFASKTALVALASLGALALGAHANPAAGYSVEFERPYGYGYGQEDTPYTAGTRDAFGNRVIVNGRMMVGDDLSSLPSGMWNLNGLSNGDGLGGNSQAVGNQLNVITNGSWNTVIITNEQINYGDVNANVLNGEINLND
jgi:holdfast attachment protein HfaA